MHEGTGLHLCYTRDIWNSTVSQHRRYRSLIVLMPLFRPWAKTQPVWLCWNQWSYPQSTAAQHLPLSPPFLAKLPDFFGQSKQGIFSKCSVSLESWSRTANNYPTGFLHPLGQVFTAASTAPHPSGHPDESLPSEAARLPFHELARGWRGGVPIGWKPSAGSTHVTSVARSTSLGLRPMACNPESMLKLGFSPSWQCSDLTPWHRFGSTGHRKDIV